MRFSSSFKVGILALSAIIILLFTVMWVKGRTLSNGQRFVVKFNDINGMRAGSGVQMMGVRIGQVEELNPVIDYSNSYVEVKFVITEPNVNIPKASTISIQQSGIIGEQFLEITPPKEQVIYIPAKENMVLHVEDKVQMKLDNEYHDIGVVKNVEVVETSTVPLLIKENIKTAHSYKIKYIIDMPGVILPSSVDGKIIKDNDIEKLRLVSLENINIPYPKTSSDFTVIEPMRISDFLALQYHSAESLVETNERVSLLLSDDVIGDLQQTAVNLNEFTEKANLTIDKAQELIELSRDDIDILAENANVLIDKVSVLTDNINNLAGDKDFVASLHRTSKSVEKLSADVSQLIASEETKTTLANINTTAKNVAELSSYINDMTKDAQLKANIKETVAKINTALDKLVIALDTVNYATSDEEKLKQTLDDINATSENLKKFSTKLNKRFLLFRLMF